MSVMFGFSLKMRRLPDVVKCGTPVKYFEGLAKLRSLTDEGGPAILSRRLISLVTTAVMLATDINGQLFSIIERFQDDDGAVIFAVALFPLAVITISHERCDDLSILHLADDRNLDDECVGEFAFRKREPILWPGGSFVKLGFQDVWSVLDEDAVHVATFLDHLPALDFRRCLVRNGCSDHSATQKEEASPQSL